MPPKAEAPGDTHAFLVNCIKCARNKLEVDFDAVASVTGMSKGGASNKFRAIMKAFEEDGTMLAGKQTTGEKAPKRKASAKKALSKPEAKIEDDGSNGEEEQPPAKKAKAKSAPKKKGTAKPKEKKEASASEGEAKEEEQGPAASQEEA